MLTRFELQWTDAAQVDLDSIVDYIAHHEGAERAVTLYGKLVRKIETLSRVPRRCRIVPELRFIGISEYRELIQHPYRIFFRIVGKSVELLGVLDGRRDLEQLLIERILRPRARR
jgi:toxin ParE1/3/4